MLTLLTNLCVRFLESRGYVVRARKTEQTIERWMFRRMRRLEREVAEAREHVSESVVILRAAGELLDQREHAAARSLIAVRTGEREEVQA